MKPSTQASILGVLLFAGVVAVMAYIQRKAGPSPKNIIHFDMGTGNDRTLVYSGILTNEGFYWL